MHSCFNFNRAIAALAIDREATGLRLQIRNIRSNSAREIHPREK